MSQSQQNHQVSSQRATGAETLLPDLLDGAQRPGRLVRVMTLEERLADIRAHGREIRKNKASAVAFLVRAGIVDASGELAEPYRN